MSTFASKSFKAAGYLSARPQYPPAVYKYVHDYFSEHHAGKTGETTLVDVGSGPGEATFPQIEYYDHIVGLEPSEPMREAAKAAAAKIPGGDKVVFHAGGDADLDRVVEPASVDIVTSAEAAHWFTYPDFIERVHRVLKPGGTVAIWAYADNILVGYPKASEIHFHYNYDDSTMGPYWEQPGRNKLRDMYSHISFPDDKFTDVKRFVYLAKETTPQETDTPFLLERHLTLNQFMDYVRTYSAYHSWKEAHPDAPDVADECQRAIEAAEGITGETPIVARYNTVLILATKR